MNKLVSKNSVQRFKQGRKIVKAQFGFITPLIPRTQLKRNGSLGNGRKDGKWVAGKFIPDKNNPKDYSFMKGGTRTRTPEEQKKWESEVQRQKNLMKNDSRKVINKQRITPRFLSKYANMANTIGGANNIKVWQQKLKNYYAPGTYNPDSVWGANTQAAYERYLAEQNNNINLGLEKLNPVSISPVKESVQQNDFAQDKQNNYPSATTIQSSNPVLNQQNDFVSDRQNYYPSTATNIVSYNPNFNWRNALSELQKLHFVKQGGQLQSRNPVKFNINKN